MVRVPASMMILAGLVIFLANAGSLVLQLLAGRYLAPFIGSSVETWTSVIGVFLTGIALGNAVGGRLADRHPSTRMLGILLMVGAACSLTMLAGMRICEATGIHHSIPLTPRIPLLTFAFCLAPAFVLSLITPLTIKLMISDVRNAGGITGMIFALSTLGCLLGNYLTGFYFMADFTLDQISLGVAGSLAVLGLLVSLVGYRAPQESLVACSTVAGGDNLNNRPWKAYAIVFVASFCGMSLELTASRYLAPIVGVSLYSWTGIIGVMLAGTALGNFTGGMLADRGPWLTALARTVVSNRFVNVLMLFGLGAALGAGIAPLGSSRLGAILDFKSHSPVTIYLVGAGIGGILMTMLLLPTPEERDRMLEAGVSRTHVLSTTLLLAGAATICILAITAILNQTERVPYGEAYDYKPWFGKAFAVESDEFHYDTISTMQKLVGSDLVPQIVGWTLALFFLPMFMLGMVSPQVIRVSVPDVSHVGRVAGSIYAVSTCGAIAGTFATGYFLIALLGTWKMLLIIALALTGLATILGRLWRNSVLLFAGSIVMGAACFGMMIISKYHNKYDLETHYYAIRLNMDYQSGFREEPVAVLSLDHLQHSFVDVNNPSFLGYTHEEIQAELLRLANDQHPGANCLVIGGGGYTFPRWVDYTLPAVKTDVVEIDPGVTRVAYERLALSSRRVETGFLLGGVGVAFTDLWSNNAARPQPSHAGNVIVAGDWVYRRPSRITTFNMDGRQYVNEVAAPGQYHLVMQDAVNDLSVPYHLLTKEYNDGIKRILAPDGVYLLTLIDAVHDGVLWRSAVETMRHTFQYVYMISPDAFADSAAKLIRERHVMIVYGADKPIDLDALHAVLLKSGHTRSGQTKEEGQSSSFTHVMDPEVLEEAMKMKLKGVPYEGKPILLTDQYAPVDNLMSGVFRDRDEK